METFVAGRSLVAHPDHPARTIERVGCSLAWQDAGRWAVDFIVEAPADALNLPRPAAPERADRLWEATCFELFVRDAAGAYLEFNFSPSGQWAAYRFDSYREGMRPLDVARPRVLTSDPEQFAASMAVHLAEIGIEPTLARGMAADRPRIGEEARPRKFALSAILEDASLAGFSARRLGLNAVLDEAEGTRSYWALSHPPGDPDFHNEACFGLELPPAPAP